MQSPAHNLAEACATPVSAIGHLKRQANRLSRAAAGRGSLRRACIAQMTLALPAHTFAYLAHRLHCAGVGGSFFMAEAV
jgi:hypothetical protein